MREIVSISVFAVRVLPQNGISKGISSVNPPLSARTSVCVRENCPQFQQISSSPIAVVEMESVAIYSYSPFHSVR